jgi:hypothetical protein
MLVRHDPGRLGDFRVVVLLAEQQQADPPANSAAATNSTSRSGSRANTAPMATAITTWTANAAATPQNTGSGRKRVPSTSEANIDLSGSSAGKITTNVVKTTARSTASL